MGFMAAVNAVAAHGPHAGGVGAAGDTLGHELRLVAAIDPDQVDVHRLAVFADELLREQLARQLH